MNMRQPNQIPRAVIIPSEELNRIKSHSEWISKQSQDGIQRHEQFEKMKSASQNIVKNWKNTVLNKQKERLERRLERTQRDEDRKNATYHASLQEAADNRKKIIQEARRIILFDKDDIHQVNSALVFSEVLRERAKQIEFIKNMKDAEDKAKKRVAEQIKADIKVHEEQEVERKTKEHQAKMERKAQNIKMMKERAENEAMLLSSEKEHEKRDLADMEAEMKQVKENIDREIHRKKEHVKRDAHESITLKRQQEEMQRQEDEDEEKVVQIYCKVKQRMACMRRNKELEAHAAKLDNQEKIRAIIAESLKEKEEDIDSMIANALQEKEKMESEKLKRRKEYEAKLLKERKDYMEEVDNQKRKEEKEYKELKQWLLMQRLKREEMNKIAEMKKKESDWNTKMNVRLGYNAQIEEKREIKKQACQEDLDQHNYVLKVAKREDEDFFNYAQEILEECKATRRPLYPVQKVISGYRKKHGIIQREKYDKWVEENALLEKQEQEMEGHYCQHLELTNGTCIPSMTLFPPLLKK